MARCQLADTRQAWSSHCTYLFDGMLVYLPKKRRVSVTDWLCHAHLLQVLRGYVGDREAKPVFDSPTPFDVLGTGYQRPFELATLRLFNMIGILPKCEWWTGRTACRPGVTLFSCTLLPFMGGMHSMPTASSA